jgi:hypothetical protein
MFTINTEAGETTCVPLHIPRPPPCPRGSLVRVNIVETVPV